MGGSTNGDAFIGTGTVMSNGTTVANTQIFLDGQFIASSIVVPAEQSFVDLTTPFTFAGTLRAMNGSDEIFRQALVGSGTAFARLFLDEPGQGFNDESNAIAYIFEPGAAATPEPTSILLWVGSGGIDWTAVDAPADRPRREPRLTISPGLLTSWLSRCSLATRLPSEEASDSGDGRLHSDITGEERRPSLAVQKKSRLLAKTAQTNNPGSDLLSHAVTHAVPSAVAGLTSVFGMGTGVTLLL